MSTIDLPASTRLQQSISSTLSLPERLRLGTQLGSAMLATGLLLLGVLLRWAGPLENRGVAELIKGMAAVVVSLPLLWIAAREAWSGAASLQGGQLVLLATLAAFAQGDFLTAALIPILMTIGHVLEERSILGAQAAIDGLRRFQDRPATVVKNDEEHAVSADELRAGDLLIVRPGELIPADGIVRHGSSAVDQSSLTGESHPEDVGAGSQVFAGTMNLTGLVRIEVTRSGSGTTIGRVVELLHDAERSKTPVMRLIEQYSAWYTPAVLIIAAIVLALSRDMSRAVAVLVVCCPMAIILAGPAAMVAALAAASRIGILVKNAKFLEVLSDVQTVILDKTGTVTLGQLEVSTLLPTESVTEDELLQAATTCASGSRHPVSRAIVARAESVGTDVTPADEVTEVAGKGVIGRLGAITLFVGRADWLAEQGVSVSARHREAIHTGGSLVWVGRKLAKGDSSERELLGALVFQDGVRSEARAALDDLRRLGVSRHVLLTGDRRAEAERVSAALAVDTCIAEVLPEQKLDVVHAERSSGFKVMVVGDGVNDALALASGDVGIAMGAAGSDVALRSADVVLMASDLRRLPQAIELARRTRRTMHQNVLLGTAISLVMLGLAASGTVSPVAGAALHNVSEIYVLLNSARLLRFAPRFGT